MTEFIKVYGPETKEEKAIRIKQKARKYLETDEDIDGSPTLRNMVEETLNSDIKGNVNALYNLLEKLRNASYYDKLVSYKGDSGATAYIERLLNIVHEGE